MLASGPRTPPCRGEVHSAPKTSSRSRHYFTFYFSKKSLIFHAIYLFNNIKYFFEFVTTLYHGKFWKKEKKGKDQSRYIL